MKHRASPRFCRCYRQLPEDVQRLADESYRLLREDPRHPSLHFKRIGRFWSVRVGLHYRALAVQHEEDVVWFWVGPHAEYDRAVGVNIMDYHVVEARYVGGHIVWLRFRDGTAGEIDLASALEGPVFEPLRDPTTFREFQIHPEFHTLTWPNDADFAPEFLYDNVRVTA